MSLLGVREVFTGAVSKEQELPPSLSACAEGSVWDAEEGRCQPRGRAEARALYPDGPSPVKGWVCGGSWVTWPVPWGCFASLPQAGIMESPWTALLSWESLDC